MARMTSLVDLPMIALNPASPQPRYRQLYDGLRAAILSGQLAPGTRLPSTRALAAALGVARNTVVNAFEQLIAEGYLEGRVGSGTAVAATLPDDLLRAARPKQAIPPAPDAGRAISRRGMLLASTRVSTGPAVTPVRPFRTGTPDFSAFPFDIWAHIAARHWRQPTDDMLTYGDPAGYLPLRTAIAAHLGESRAVRCTAEQVLIISGSQQGLDLAARLLLDPGDPAWIEDPGYSGARGALTAAGARLVPVPVDAEGIDVAAGTARESAAKLVYVSPSHQFPTGVMLSLKRRLALLDWAARTHAWVLEDDYDSEYRYAGRPLAALQGLDAAGRVIYIGTFSKVLFPSLRLGYLVVPPDLVPAFTAARALIDRHSPTIEQAILADFIAEGHFARHIRRMRALYAQRQASMLSLSREILGDLLPLEAANAGLQLVGRLPDEVDDRAISDRCAAAGISAPPLSAFALSAHPRRGLLLGYAAFPEETQRRGLQKLARVLREFRRQ